MEVITIANQKGGIGKTTTATTMASILRERGFRTLLIDADPQRNSSAVYSAKSEGVATLYDALAANPRMKLSETVQHTKNGDIVASDKLMRDADIIFLQDSTNGIFRLQEALEDVEDDYDYVIIDTNPTIDRIMYNALVAADKVIIPTSAALFGVMGLNDLIETIIAVKKRSNQKLKVEGILIVAFKGHTNFAKSVKGQLEKFASDIGTKIFKTPIRASIKVEESQASLMPLNKYAPKCTSAEDYQAFMDEFLEGDR